MTKEIYWANGAQFVRVTKRSAMRLFDRDRTIYLIANKVRFNNPWISPCPISNMDVDFRNEVSFKQLVNNFQYYNCNYECGYSVKYFVKKEDLK